MKSFFSRTDPWLRPTAPRWTGQGRGAIGSGSVTPELRNWSGTYRFPAPTVIAARTIDEVRRAVTSAGRVRALGTRHSFNDLADNGDTLVTVTGIASEPVLDEAARTVTVGAGGRQRAG